MAQSTDETPWPLLRPLQGATLAGLGVDLAAGLTLAAIAIPEQMATARLAGLAPQIGLFAFVAASVGFIVFGANRVLSAGADSTIAPIFAGSLAALAAAGTLLYGELAAVLALMVGLLVALAGIARLGWIADLLSRPVLTGFLAGIALHIVVSQAPAALGLPDELWPRLPAARPTRRGVRPDQLDRRCDRGRRVRRDARRRTAQSAHPRRADRPGRAQRSRPPRWGSASMASRCLERCRAGCRRRRCRRCRSSV